MNYCKSETFSVQLVEITFLKTGSPQSQLIRTLQKCQRHLLPLGRVILPKSLVNILRLNPGANWNDAISLFPAADEPDSRCRNSSVCGTRIILNMIRLFSIYLSGSVSLCYFNIDIFLLQTRSEKIVTFLKTEIFNYGKRFTC